MYMSYVDFFFLIVTKQNIKEQFSELTALFFYPNRSTCSVQFMSLAPVVNKQELLEELVSRMYRVLYVDIFLF